MKMATWRGVSKVAKKVVIKTRASERVESKQTRMVLGEMREMAMAMTSPAKTALGMRETMGKVANKKVAPKQSRPQMMEAKGVRAPEEKLRAERVSEPEAGMAARKEAARLAIPTENMS